jgi:ABC-2 type transport system permease protein
VKNLKNKLWYLIGVSLKRKIKSKWFVIVNIILMFAIVGLFNIDSIIGFFGGDFNEKQKIYVIDNTNTSFEIFKDSIEKTDINLKNSNSYEVKKYNKSLEDGKKKIKKEEKAIIIELNSDEKDILKAKVISNTFIDTIDYQIITNCLTNLRTNYAIASLGLSEDEITKLYSDIKIDRIILDENKKSKDENMETIMSTVFPFIILPFFILSIYLVQMIGAEVNDEKTTRGMEIIISNVSPKTHFASKIIAGNTFVLIQGIILLLDSAIGLLVRKLMGGSNLIAKAGFDVTDILKKALDTDLINQLIYIIPLMLISMILTFIAYSLVAGILASMTTNTEDFQQVQTPIVLVSLVGYYLSMMAGIFKGAAFIKVLSFVPFISAILAPSLLVLGQISILDVIIGIIILIFTNFILVKYGLRIYKVGILNYSSKDLWKKMFKAIKN